MLLLYLQNLGVAGGQAAQTTVSVGKSKKHLHTVEHQGKILVFSNKEHAKQYLAQTNAELKSTVDATSLEAQENQPQTQEIALTHIVEVKPLQTVNMAQLKALAQLHNEYVQYQRLLKGQQYDMLISMMESYLDDEETELLMLGIQ